MEEGRERTFVFPGERVTVICTIEEYLTADQVEALENKHCYWLGFHPSSDSGTLETSTPRGDDDDECDGDAGCASVLEGVVLEPGSGREPDVSGGRPRKGHPAVRRSRGQGGHSAGGDGPCPPPRQRRPRDA